MVERVKKSKKKAYLDIETDYTGPYDNQRLFRDHRNHDITVVGIRVLGRGEDVFVQLVGKDITKRNILKALKGVDCLVTYNGRSIPDDIKGFIGFDFPVIKARLGVTLDREFPHIDLVPLCWERGLYGGQKKVEGILGLERELVDKDGEWACHAWRKYNKTKDERYLRQLLKYNKEDVFMLERIERMLEK